MATNRARRSLLKLGALAAPLLLLPRMVHASAPPDAAALKEARIVAMFDRIEKRAIQTRRLLRNALKRHDGLEYSRIAKAWEREAAAVLCAERA